MKTTTGGVGRWLMAVIMLVATSVPRADAELRGRDDQHLDVQRYFEILGEAIATLQQHYVDSIDWSAVLTTGLDAMLEGLDPYTEFYNEEDEDEWRTMTTGEYGGIGALIQQHGDSVVIADPYVGMPAADAGLRVGDRIVAIDGRTMVGHTTAEVSEKLRGEAGTSLRLTYVRPHTADGEQTVEIVRRKIVLPAVPYYGWLADSVAYIRLDQFTDKAATEVQMALRSMAGARGLVFDLRGNAGGLLDEAVKIVSLFVPRGSVVVETKAKLPEWNATYRTSAHPVEPSLPVVVLVDRGSASASEIVAGALQDMDRAVVMGERSFGKGLVQSSRSLPYNTLIKFTSAKYYIPSGRCIQAVDYSHRREDGSVERIPDSLTHEFRTLGGRPVRDGGGILPDEVRQPEVMSPLLYVLTRQSRIFDYATRFRSVHDTIAAAASFRLPDDEYAAFCQWVGELENDTLLRRFDIVDLPHDLDSLHTEVADALEGEIVLRYYSDRGRTEHTLLRDKLVQEAVSLVVDTEKYNNILIPHQYEEKSTPAAGSTGIRRRGARTGRK